MRFNLSEWALKHRSLVVFMMIVSVVAGLAAYYRLKEGRSVAVAKVEREPAGEADPLRIFADSIGLTVETVSGRRELADVVSTNLGAELLLIDQPGHSLLDWEALSLAIGIPRKGRLD